MTGPALILGVPSKGRLLDDTAALFAQAGHPLQRGSDRLYRGVLGGMPGIEVAFLSTGEIARQIATQDVHLGITGEDLAREHAPDADARYRFFAPLGFGHADVVVAVPGAWLDVRCMADLDEAAADFRRAHRRPMRVATKYLTLTRAFFARHDISAYRIVESVGATEGTPAAGAAELIVDITSTGDTLRANGLRVLADGLILSSQAMLIGHREPDLPPAALALRDRLVRCLSTHASNPPSTLSTAPVM